MRQEESLLAPTKIESKNEYKSGNKSDTESTLSSH